MYSAQSTPDRNGIYKRWLLRRGENRSTRRKTFLSKDENQQQIQPTFDAESGYRTWPHWWEASALTTAPSLLPIFPQIRSDEGLTLGTLALESLYGGKIIL